MFTDRPSPPSPLPTDADAGITRSLRYAVLVGAVVFALALIPLIGHFAGPPRSGPQVTALAAYKGPADAAGPVPHDAPAPAAKAPRSPVIADFGKERASRDARLVAGWSLFTGDNQLRSVIIVDKRAAKVFVFNPQGKLVGAAPALLGLAHGDHTVPGIGDRPIAQVRPDERTTPAGRFIAEPGINIGGEDVVWVDYDAAVSMHRVRPLVKAERRLERLASRSPDDNRISYGCINLPPAFYENVVSRAVGTGQGAVIYVLPEATTPEELFGAWFFEGAALAIR